MPCRLYFLSSFPFPPFPFPSVIQFFPFRQNLFVCVVMKLQKAFALSQSLRHSSGVLAVDFSFFFFLHPFTFFFFLLSLFSPSLVTFVDARVSRAKPCFPRKGGRDFGNKGRKLMRRGNFNGALQFYFWSGKVLYHILYYILLPYPPFPMA